MLNNKVRFTPFVLKYSKVSEVLCMRISAIGSMNFSTGNVVRQKTDNRPRIYYAQTPVNFGMRVDYGIPAKLAEPLQKKIENIHKNIDLIQNFFADYTVKNPQLGAKIKKGYPDLIPKRQSGIVFKLPENTIEVMRSQTRDNILYISIDDGSNEFNGIVVDGKDKLIANVLKRHPHMLPRGIKHMNAERMEQAQPEKFINLADEKIQGYSDYVRKLQSGEIPMPKVGLTPARKEWLDKNGIKTTRQVNAESVEPKEIKPKKQKITKYLDRTDERKSKIPHKPSKMTTAEYLDYMTEKSKKIIKKVSELLLTDSKDLPPHLNPKTGSNGKPLGFTIKTDDGGELKVMRKIVGSYGSSMPYLSFEKSNPDNTMNFISLDMISNKVLRTKDRGKPHISSDHVVYELTPDELKKRKIEDKLDYYMSQIFREQPDEVKHATKTEPVVADVKKEVEKTENIAPKEKTVRTEKKVVNNDLEKLKTDMRELGKRDGSIAATEYFNAFKEQFITDLKEKMSAFNSEVHKFLESLSEKKS